MGFISKERFNQIILRLNQLKDVDFPNVVKQISNAKEHGDLSENAEYDAAKKRQREIYAEINKLEKILSESEILDVSKIDKNKIDLLSHVKLKNKKSGTIETYHLVSNEEASFLDGKISISSPLGMVLKNKKVGDIVKLKRQNGDIEFEILDIEY